MKFETARICVLRRSQKLPDDLIESNPFEEPTYEFEVVAWPPGEVDGGLLPHNGDQLTLPGYDAPFRVVDRTLHWPPPTSAEARRGEIRVDLIVEPEPDSPTKSPFGRPGTENGGDRRWVSARIQGFETRDSAEKDADGNPRRQYTRVMFDVTGVGLLVYYAAFVWQVQALFPGAMADLGPQGIADHGTFRAMLQEARNRPFEVEVGPQTFREVERLRIFDARPGQEEN